MKLRKAPPPELEERHHAQSVFVVFGAADMPAVFPAARAFASLPRPAWKSRISVCNGLLIEYEQRAPFEALGAQVPKRAAPAAADEVPQTSPKFCQRPSLAPLGLELRGTETLSRSRAS
eukprot:CAMPEP_0206536198 /NCGR_PEP_ID=MMETSP0325_2-20121206/6609_1 /ASSEMBLY_ACC=CAM_ASM_000347 /TAXON_ID=2866 /ORGANISM="Crypthecodinium cohnii, Strain Seligo" /LENGTH=118 /DNA_ID=CAMNT_0054033369 /DNA_START=162 /DNA_END=516 /DNA_ORIENTATION=+